MSGLARVHDVHQRSSESAGATSDTSLALVHLLRHVRGDASMDQAFKQLETAGWAESAKHRRVTMLEKKPHCLVATRKMATMTPP